MEYDIIHLGPNNLNESEAKKPIVEMYFLFLFSTNVGRPSCFELCTIGYSADAVPGGGKVLGQCTESIPTQHCGGIWKANL